MSKRFFDGAVVVRLCVLCLAVAAGRTASGADFYVAPDGKDANPGTAAAPFATLARARDAVREKVAAGLTDNVLVLIRGGAYRQSETLTFGPPDSGTERYSVTYAACPGEKVVVSGGQAITGWKKGNGEIWTAELPDVKAGKWYFRQLFVNDRRAVRARTPNVDEKKPYCTIRQSSLVEGSSYLGGLVPKSRDVFFKEITVKVDRPIRVWKNVSDVEFTWWNNNNGSRKRLGSVNEQDQTFTIPPPHQWPPLDFPAYYHVGYPLPQYPGYFENALEFLDQPGEWYLDRATGLLHYWPRAGEDMTRAEVVAPRVQNILLAVVGTRERPVWNLRFRGLHVEHVDWLLPPYGYFGDFGCLELISAAGKPPFHMRPIEAAVSFRHARGCNFTDGGVAHVGGIGLAALAGCTRSVIEGNDLHDIGGGAIFAGALRNRHTWQWAEPGEPDDQQGYRIANNHIHHCGTDYFGAIGIFLTNIQDTVVAHNLIHDISYAGIVLAGNEAPGQPAAKNNVVEYNDIYDVMKVATDGAAIYGSFLHAGWGAVLRGNVLHDSSGAPFNPRDKLQNGGPGPWTAPGIYMDGGTGQVWNYTFAHNVVFHSVQSPIFLFLCSQEGNRFVDNIFLKAGSPPAVFVEALRARAGIEPAYRRSLLKTNAPESNYYPLTGDSGSSTTWAAYQFDMPEAGKGVVEVFRRVEAKEASLRVKPRALSPDAVYDLKTWIGTFDPRDELLLLRVATTDRPATGPAVLVGGEARMTGRQVMEKGLLVRLTTRPQVAWVAYQRARGLAAMAEVACPRGEVPLAVVLHGEHSFHAGGTIRKYAWDFGDGTTAEGPAVQHVYATPGTYTAKLTVADDKGATDQTGVVVVATPVDSTPPVMARIESGDPRKVVVTFSKPVEQSSAEATANYTFNQVVRILSASLGEDRATVTLATSPLAAGITYALTVSNVKDRARKPNVIATNSRRTVCYSGLLAHWKLDEGKGDTVADCSDNGHHGTLRNGPQWAAGQRGGALSFSGSAACVEIDTSLSELAVPLSIAFWVNPAKSQVPNANILGNHGDYWVGLGMEQQGNNTNAFGFGYGDGTRWLGTGPVKLAADAWQHVAAVCDGQYAFLYVNGVERSKSPAKGPLVPNPDQHFKLGLGYKPDAKRCFHGLLQDVRIYGRALSAAEIAGLAGQEPAQE